MFFFHTPVWEGEASHWCKLPRFFLKNPAGRKQRTRSMNFWFGSCRVIFFFLKHLLCKRGGWWDKVWYTSVRRGSLPLVYATKIFFWNPAGWKQNSRSMHFWFDFGRLIFHKNQADWKQRWFFWLDFYKDFFFNHRPPTQGRELMGQVLVHQCEKGKPPIGVCYRDFFWKNPTGWKHTWRSVNYWFGFCRVIFSKRGLLCKRGNCWWDKFWYTSVRRGSLPLVYATFFWTVPQAESKHEEWRSMNLWFEFFKVFSIKGFLCQGGGWWDKLFRYTSVRRGSLPQVYVKAICITHASSLCVPHTYIHNIKNGASHTNYG